MEPLCAPTQPPASVSVQTLVARWLPPATLSLTLLFMLLVLLLPLLQTHNRHQAEVQAATRHTDLSIEPAQHNNRQQQPGCQLCGSGSC